MDNGDPRFPYPRYLGVDFVFVPDGNPLPLEWMAAHPNYVTISAVFVPDPPREPNMGLEPQTRAEGRLELLQDVGTYEVEIDYAGNWIIKGVTVPMPRSAPPPEPPSAWPQEPEPAGWPNPVLPADHPAGPTSHRRQPEPPTPPPWPPGISKPEADRLFAVGYRAGREAAQSHSLHARNDLRTEAVEQAIIAQARADGLAALAGAAALDPVVDVATVAALAALGLIAAVESEPPHPYRPARSASGFEPPPPSPPLPGLVPPPSPQRKPGEGGFTPAPQTPPTPPLPGFTPSPPSAPVHPGRPAEANKPIVVDADNLAGGEAAAAANPVNPADLAQLRANGVKFNSAAVFATGRNANGEVVFLEKGDQRSGLQHIIDEHGEDFKNIGVSEHQIPSVIMEALTKGVIVGYQGTGKGRPVYQIEIDGRKQNIAITVGNNGYIVGANPAGRVQ
jgi:hypothetical protein